MNTYTCAYQCKASLRKSLEMFRKEGREAVTFPIVVKADTEFHDSRMAKVYRAALD